MKKWLHILQLIVMNLIIIGVSAFAIFYSLGYEYNGQTNTFRQTGIIELEGVDTPVTVSVNGKVMSDKLPFRYVHVFPDIYTVSVKKDGYQTWNRIIRVEPNKVARFRSVLLVLETPTPTTVSEQEQKDLPLSQLSSHDIEVRSSNEIWIKDQFITRTSRDIVAIGWYPDDSHIVYQAGSDILMSELDGRNTQHLVRITSDQPSIFSFKDHNRVMLYTDGPEVKAITLY